MPTRPLTECWKPGCHNLVTAGYCETHKAEPQKQDTPRRNEAFYNSRLWKTTSRLVRTYNPICQHIQPDGCQCRNVAVVTHHIIDPTVNAQASTDWDNLVALCTQCHPGGTPGDADLERYVHTYGPMESCYRHLRHADWYSGPIPEQAAPMSKPGAFGTPPEFGIVGVVSSLPSAAPAAVSANPVCVPPAPRTKPSGGTQ
jgi:5-methylcytosine-specific restriction endonuclease McrA